MHVGISKAVPYALYAALQPRKKRLWNRKQHEVYLCTLEEEEEQDLNPTVGKFACVYFGQWRQIGAHLHTISTHVVSVAAGPWQVCFAKLNQYFYNLKCNSRMLVLYRMLWSTWGTICIKLIIHPNRRRRFHLRWTDHVTQYVTSADVWKQKKCF